MIKIMLKQAKRSAYVARKIIMFSLWINIILINTLTDIYSCFKQKIDSFFEKKN